MGARADGGVFLPAVVSGVVVQDEFTHDVIVPYRYGLVLVYDTTCRRSASAPTPPA